MAKERKRLSTKELNQLFLSSLGSTVLRHETVDEKPFLVDLMLPSFPAKVSVYLYNCTNPPGGRKSDEYKGQIIVPGQQRGQRGHFDYSDGRIVLLGAFAMLADTVDSGVFVFWDAVRHDNFSYSANIQVKSDILIAALVQDVSLGIKSNGETIVACRPENLVKGIETRIMTVST